MAILPLAAILAQALPQAAADTIRMTLAWQVSEGRHPGADSLGELSGVALDAAGNVYLSDFSAIKVWVFDRGGRLKQPIGRQGKGPGEFEAPTGLGIGPDGRLYVRDITRVSIFARDPKTGALTRFAGSFPGQGVGDWRSTLATRFDAESRLYYPEFDRIDRTARTGFYLRYSKAGALLDTLVVPAFAYAPAATASVRTSPGGGRMLAGLNHPPFAPLPVWDVTPRGTLVTGNGTSYRLEEKTADGRLVRSYGRAEPPDRIPRNERRDSTAALKARLDSVPGPLDQVQGMPPEVRALKLPEFYPPYLAVHAPPDGRIWVQRWPVGGPERSVFDVFDPDGRLRAVVILPLAIASHPSPVLSLTDVVGVRIDPETGAHQVARFRAPR